MSKFGDLINISETVETVEIPVVEAAPVIDTAPSSLEPVVEEAPRPEEEVADIVYESDVSFQDMSKDELEDYGRTVGIELDRRHNKKKLIQELEDHLES